VKRYQIQVLDYMVTSNHVNLLMTARRGQQISRAMQFLHGDMAQHYNSLDALLAALDFPNHQRFLAWYDDVLTELLVRRSRLRRQPFWREAAAVGETGWLQDAAEVAGLKRVETTQSKTDPDWAVPGGPSSFLRRKNAAKPSTFFGNKP